MYNVTKKEINNVGTREIDFLRRTRTVCNIQELRNKEMHNRQNSYLLILDKQIK